MKSCIVSSIIFFKKEEPSWDLKLPSQKKQHNMKNALQCLLKQLKKLTALDCKITIEKDAGLNSAYTDSAYKEAGAKIAKDYADTVKGADIILKVQAPNTEELQELSKDSLLIAMLAPFANEKIFKDCAKAKITAFLHGICATHNPRTKYGCTPIPIKLSRI